AWNHPTRRVSMLAVIPATQIPSVRPFRLPDDVAGVRSLLPPPRGTQPKGEARHEASRRTTSCVHSQVYKFLAPASGEIGYADCICPSGRCHVSMMHNTRRGKTSSRSMQLARDEIVQRAWNRKRCEWWGSY